MCVSWAAISLTGCVRDDRVKTEEYVGIGDPVPVFSVMNYDSAQTIGKITLLTFFDPTCSDCQRELPLLEYVWGNLKNTPDFEMINIARGRTLENLAATEGGDRWLLMPSYPDPERIIYNLFATSTIPRIYLIDRQGVVCEKWVENTHLSAEQLLSVVKSYVEKP